MEQQRIWNHFQTERLDVFRGAQGRYSAMIDEACARVSGQGDVLNIGIGPGALERALRARGWRVAALDPSERSTESLKKEGIDARVGWAEQMSFDTASFDVVVASEVLEHIEPGRRESVYREVLRVLKPGGWFIGSVPYREDLSESEVVCPDCGKIFHRWGHVSHFDVDALREELDRHFDVVLCRRTAFVDWSQARSPMGFIRALAKFVLGRLGEPIVSPSIQFSAQVPDRP